MGQAISIHSRLRQPWVSPEDAERLIKDLGLIQNGDSGRIYTFPPPLSNNTYFYLATNARDCQPSIHHGTTTNRINRKEADR